MAGEGGICAAAGGNADGAFWSGDLTVAGEPPLLLRLLPSWDTVGLVGCDELALSR